MDRQPFKKILGASKKIYKTPPDPSIHLIVVVVNVVCSYCFCCCFHCSAVNSDTGAVKVVVVAEVAVVIKTGRIG